LAISIILTFDGEANLLEYAIRPSVIKVDRLLTYGEVQGILAQEADQPGDIPLELATLLQSLFFNLSPAIKAQRQQRGSFEILGLETLDPYKDEGRLGAIASYPATPVRSLLAELVAVANQAVANHFHALGLPLLYCVQSAPDPADLQDLIKLGSNLQLDMQLQQEEEISPNDYQQFCQEFAKSKHHRVLHYLLQGTLKPVLFRTKPGRHFGLALDSGYTRCSQPWGRYGDLVVQRLIHVLADKGRDRKTTRTKESIDLFHSSSHGQFDWSILPPDLHQEWEATLTTLISHINDREKVALDAEQDWRGLHKAEQMKRRTGEIFTGLITGVQSYGFFVEIEDLLVQGLVHVSSLKDDWYEYRSRYSCLVGRKNRTAYRLGDQGSVQVKNVDYYRQQIDLVTVGDGNQASNEELEDEE
jgi:ribonuclease R